MDFTLKKLNDGFYQHNFHSCLASAFNISVQLVLTRSQSTMFRAVHSMHVIITRENELQLIIS